MRSSQWSNQLIWGAYLCSAPTSTIPLKFRHHTKYRITSHGAIRRWNYDQRAEDEGQCIDRHWLVILCWLWSCRCMLDIHGEQDCCGRCQRRASRMITQVERSQQGNVITTWESNCIILSLTRLHRALTSAIRSKKIPKRPAGEWTPVPHSPSLLESVKRSTWPTSPFPLPPWSGFPVGRCRFPPLRSRRSSNVRTEVCPSWSSLNSWA